MRFDVLATASEKGGSPFTNIFWLWALSRCDKSPQLLKTQPAQLSVPVAPEAVILRIILGARGEQSPGGRESRRGANSAQELLCRLLFNRLHAVRWVSANMPCRVILD
jgi:hypothetical protein